jgi:hypothetical protein
MLIVFLAACIMVCPWFRFEVGADGLEKLDEGLFLGRFSPQPEYPLLDCPIVILKIEPQQYALKLLSASEHGGNARTARQWCKGFGLAAAMNASMYQATNPLMSTGYMRNYGHVNNPTINPAFGAFLAFNPMVPAIPTVQIIDKYKTPGWKDLIKKYHTVIQNYRMISNGRRTGWPYKDKVYRTAAIGTDQEGNVLFILGRYPSSTQDFIRTLLSLPIRIRTAMYVEGGLEADLHLRVNDAQDAEAACTDKTTSEAAGDASGWAIPNVIGIQKQKGRRFK